MIQNIFEMKPLFAYFYTDFVLHATDKIKRSGCWHFSGSISLSQKWEHSLKELACYLLFSYWCSVQMFCQLPWLSNCNVPSLECLHSPDNLLLLQRSLGRARCREDRMRQVPGCWINRNSPRMSQRVKRRRDNSNSIFRKCDALPFWLSWGRTAAVLHYCSHSLQQCAAAHDSWSLPRRINTSKPGLVTCAPNILWPVYKSRRERRQNYTKM